MSELSKLKSILSEAESKYNSMRGQVELLESQMNEGYDKIKALEDKNLDYKKCIELLMILDADSKTTLKKYFEEIVTYALQYIFNDKYKFQLMFGRRGNSQEIDFLLETPNSTDLHDPLISSGGGILDILSLALRISLMELTRPRIPGFLVLDEPFKHLSDNYIDMAGEFLRAINLRIKRQIILVTHKEPLINFADNKIKISQTKKVEETKEAE